MKRLSFFELAAYFALFGLLFLQFPLTQSLPGNTDTLLAIALSNLCWERVWLLLSGSSTATVLFPARDFMAYGENCYGLALIFLLFKAVFRSDLWAYWAFLTTLFALTAAGYRSFCSLFSENRAILFGAGLIFPLLSVSLGSIDDPNVVFMLFPLLSIGWLEEAIRGKKPKLLKRAALAAGAQVWFGFYAFVSLLLLGALWIAFRFKEFNKAFKTKDLTLAATALLLPALPLLSLYVFNHFRADIASPYDLELTTRHSSMSWHNFLNVQPGNLIYSAERNLAGPDDVGGWHPIRKLAFPGIVWILLVTWGATGGKSDAKSRRMLSALFLIFFALSFGTHQPLFSLFAHAPFGQYFRVPLRFLFFALIPAAALFALSLERVKSLRKWPKHQFTALAGVVCTVVLIENVPFPLRSYPIAEWLTPPSGYTEYFASSKERERVLDLPSTCFYPAGEEVNEGNPLWFYSREILYMNWQTHHRQILPNGVNSYVPRSRAELEAWLQQLPSPSALAQARKLGVRYLVFHKDLVLHRREAILDVLRTSPGLSLRHEDPRIAILEITAS